jgi:hypothetical protein
LTNFILLVIVWLLSSYVIIHDDRTEDREIQKRRYQEMMAPLCHDYYSWRETQVDQKGDKELDQQCFDAQVMVP